MLADILGSKLREKILLFLLEGGESYAWEIARWFELNINAVQAQLTGLEKAGILVSWYERKRRFFELESRYYLFPELEALLEKHYRSLPYEEQRKYHRMKRRARGQASHPALQAEAEERRKAFLGRLAQARRDPCARRSA